MLSPGQIQQLAAAAVAAPSADNHHVFRLAPADSHLDLIPVPSWPEWPLGRRILGMISVGAAAENLRLQARVLGLQPLQVEGPVDGEVSALRLLRLALSRPTTDPHSDIDPKLAAAIRARRSNRRVVFHGPMMTSDQLADVKACEAQVPGAQVCWFDGKVSRQRALRLIRLAEVARFEHPALHRELFESIRFDLGWTQPAEQGLPPGSLELPWIERLPFKALRHWSVQRLANGLGMHRLIGWRAADLPCRLAPHLGAISAQGDLMPAAFAAGRLLQRVWLQATVMGFEFQVFAASPLYAVSGSVPIEAPLCAELAAGWQALCAPGRPFVAFRMGHAKAPTLRAGRPAPETLLIRPG